jgi:hypothetical protein
MTPKNEPRKDETPATFAELKPPGYWSATLNRSVEVRMVHGPEALALQRRVRAWEKLARASDACRREGAAWQRAIAEFETELDTLDTLWVNWPRGVLTVGPMALRQRLRL